ncbi:hypothetical protein J4Q44_G00056630 [Coregonus suidteri]|uniref:Uncharacterized protein n=1 Tax=Coregonus suidteri TaxID=861788 RepID=A0AAN8M5Q8_9TELE
MSDGQDTSSSALSTATTPTKIQGPQHGGPAAGALPWAGQHPCAPEAPAKQREEELPYQSIRTDHLPGGHLRVGKRDD